MCSGTPGSIHKKEALVCLLVIPSVYCHYNCEDTKTEKRLRKYRINGFHDEETL